MNNNPRAAALEALLQVDENNGYSNIVLDKTIKKYDFDKRDNALISIIFYGVIEKRITLDYLINRFLKSPQLKLSDAARNILRMAVYQFLFLEKIPESAAVNEAVNLAKDNDVPPTFINGVLREIIRNKSKLILPKDDSPRSLAINYSVPEELIRLWQESYGNENTLKLLESFSQKAYTHLRVNNTKTNVLELAKKLGDEFTLIKNPLDFSYYVSGGNLVSTEAFEQGDFHVQDLSSQYLCQLLNPQENENIVDVCAAPGGKTFTISEMMKGTGTVYAYDLYKGRVKLIRAGAYRLGLENILSRMRDASNGEFELDNADRVLCDVPCSGFGTIRRKPEIRYKSLAELEELPEIQYNILNHSKNFLKKGGILVYSTCTLNPNENGKIADKFLQNNSDFEAVELPNILPRIIDEPKNQLTIMPFAANCDGFFVAIFRKKN